MIKDFNVDLNEREINTILFLIDHISESTKEYLGYSEKHDYPDSLKEKFQELIKN